MGTFEITAPDGQKYRITGETETGALNALKQHLGQSEPSPQRDMVATTDDGGSIYRAQDGSLSFSSPAFSTNDPERIAQIMQGATPADLSKSSFDQSTLEQAPVTARAVKAIEGVPFVGSYVDEAAGAMFGDEARQGVRAVSGAMERQNPGESLALSLGGTVAGAVPMAVAAGPAIVNTGKTLGAKALQFGLGGAAVGAAEGAIYGAGREGDRAENATAGATLGAIAGGAMGAAAPYVGAGIKRGLMSLRGSDTKAISKTLSISPEAARVVKSALDAGDPDAAITALQRAGPQAMLADAGQPAAQLLDAAAATGGAAGRIAGDAVEARVTGASDDLMRSLDRTLGKPSGVKEMARVVREGTAGARSAAYDKAYSTPINYAGPRGRAIENLLSRVPRSAIDDANALMRTEGVESAQIIARIADDGKVTFERMPDVRQIDYITRALNGVADKADGQGKLGGQTPLGRAYNNLSQNIRSALKSEVPEYARALDVASDAISQVKATEAGYSLLRAATKREDVARALAGASKAEKAAAKRGVRSYIDDSLANVSRTITDPNTDAREALKLLRDMSSRANKQKISMLLGKREANRLFKEIDTATTAFELRAALAQNSKTAIRQSIQGATKQQAAPGMLETLADGEPVNATKRFVQLFTGSSSEAQALREAGIYEEIATALTQTKGKKAEAALRLVNDAMRGETLRGPQAALIADVIVSSGFLSGNREASRLLSTQ